MQTQSPSGKVLIAAPVHEVLTKGLISHGYQLVIHEKITRDTAYGLLHDCVGIITSTRLQLDKQLLDSAPRLQWIGRMGSGMEVIDVAYAKERGIALYASPDGNCDAVGEHALGMLLALLHRITWSHTEVLKGLWLREENRGNELGGKTVGIIGFGHTGNGFARKLKGFDTRILAYDKYAPQSIPADIENCKDLLPVYKNADIVSFHVPLQPDTVHYFNEVFIARMRKPFILINTSRGGVIDTNSLLTGMESGKITGACLDVFEQEPFSNSDLPTFHRFNALLSRPNLLVTPHIAGYTFQALFKMSKSLLGKIVG